MAKLTLEEDAQERGLEVELCWIHKRDLKLDPKYQREEVSETKIKEMAKNWNWSICGTLLVGMRDDGEYYVYDGGHRLRASWRIKEIGELPCTLALATDRESEAKLFCLANGQRTKVRAYDKYRAGIEAGDSDVLASEEILKRHKYKLGLTAAFNTIVAVAKWRSMVKLDCITAEGVLELLNEVAPGETFPGKVMSAIWTLARKLKSSKRIAPIDIFNDPKIRGKLTATNIQQYIRIVEDEIAANRRLSSIGENTSSARLGAQAILVHVINKRMRHKVKWDEKADEE